MELYEGIQTDLASEITQLGFALAPDAMEPLSRIDFRKLVAIHDHEEYFLRTTFINLLIALLGGPASTGVYVGEITAGDVETTLRMLGTAAAQQPEQTLSSGTKSLIRDACPFCQVSEAA